MTKESLTTLKQNDLISHLKTLVRQEKALTLQIVDYLREISRRRAYLLAHTSLFGFLVDELGYCPSTAQLRLNTLKALEVVPEARDKVLNNQISLNNLAKTQSFINQENKLLKSQSAEPLTIVEQRELFAASEMAPAHKIEQVLLSKKHELDVRKAEAQGLPPPPPKPATLKITLEADAELVEMLEELKSLVSHSNPHGDLPTLLKKVLPLAIREVKIAKGLMKRTEIGLAAKQQNPSADKGRTCTLMKSQSNSGKARVLPLSKVVRRNIPLPVKREVWKRDEGKCQFIDPKTKKICGSRHQIEFDHVKPWSFGGEHSVNNLYLCCSIHNKHRWNSISAGGYNKDLG